MPIPQSYPPESHKIDFISPRSPPIPVQYHPPIFEKFDMTAPPNTTGKWFWMSDEVRNHLVAMVGEFFGTIAFLFFGLASAQVALSKPDNINRDAIGGGPSLLQLLFISFGFGVGLAVNVWVFYRVSGGMFNPAVTFGLCLAGTLPWIKCLLLIPVQLIGGIVAAYIVSALFPGPENVQTTLGAGTTVVQGVFIEMMVTTQLVFTILMLAVEKHRATALAPVGIGLALFAGHMISINFTGASINPARTLGPEVVNRAVPSYWWIYWIGPLLGSTLAVTIYRILKWMEYQTANPAQDDDGLDTYRIVSKRRSASSYSDTRPFVDAEGGIAGMGMQGMGTMPMEYPK